MPTPRITKNDKDQIYFITFTVIEWIDVFTKREYYDMLTSVMKYAIDNSGLLLFEYVFMTNHIHMIIGTREEGKNLENIVNAFKRHTTKECKTLLSEDNRGYIITLIGNSYSRKVGNDFQIWQERNYPETITSDEFRNQKIQYIWNNPVKKGYVFNPEDWKYSSARQKILNLPDHHTDVPLACSHWA